MYITNGSYYVKKKTLTFDKDANIDGLTLEQISVLAHIPAPKDDPFVVMYYGLTDIKEEADVFEGWFKARKALKIVKKIYGDTFKVKKTEK